jgi:hypothetical protein
LVPESVSYQPIGRNEMVGAGPEHAGCEVQGQRAKEREALRGIANLTRRFRKDRP